MKRRAYHTVNAFGQKVLYLQVSLSATKDGLGSWDWGRRAEEEGGGGGGGGGDEVGGGGGGEETGEGNRGWRVFSRWLEKVREAPASPHGNWEECQQLAHFNFF